MKNFYLTKILCDLIYTFLKILFQKLKKIKVFKISKN